MRKSGLKTSDLTKIALLASLLCVSAYISVPLGFTPVPITMQTLVLSMIALILPPFQSFICVLIYVLTGFIRFPVFSGFTGGPARLFGPTGGYITAFLISAPLVSFFKPYFIRAEKKLFKKSNKATRVFVYSFDAFFAGITVMYILGTFYMQFSLSLSGFKEAFIMGVLPYIVFDAAKCIMAGLISVYIIKDIE